MPARRGSVAAFWANMGDAEALLIALTAGLEEQAGRAYGNLHASLCARRMYAEADR